MASIDSILKQLKPIDCKSKIDLLVDILEERHTIVDASIEKKVLNCLFNPQLINYYHDKINSLKQGVNQSEQIHSNSNVEKTNKEVVKDISSVENIQEHKTEDDNENKKTAPRRYKPKFIFISTKSKIDLIAQYFKFHKEELTPIIECWIQYIIIGKEKLSYYKNLMINIYPGYSIIARQAKNINIFNLSERRQRCIEKFSKRLLDYLDKNDVEKNLLNKTDSKNNLLGKTGRSSFNILQKREWILDWNCVMFKRGHIVIYARQDLGFKFSPTEVSVSKSMESFNYLKKYLNERLSPVRCEIVGLKLRIIDRINFDDAIQQFATAARQGIIRTGSGRTKVISSPQPMSFSQALSKAKQMTEEEFRKYKSKYIDFLVMEQSKQHKVIPCVERLSHANSDTTEYAFLFSLNCNSGRILIVHENVNPDRSTLLFLVKHEYYDQSIRSIYDFLQGAEVNKRSNLRSKDLELDNAQIVSYKSINHDDLYSWKQTISTYKCYR